MGEPDPFGHYEKVRAERKPLKKTIEGEEFVFPGSPPADVAVMYVNAIVSAKTDAETAATLFLPKLLSEEKGERLFELLELPEVNALAKGLFIHYGLLSDEVNPPNLTTVPTSSKQSSSDSGPSEQTSESA